MIRAPAGYVIGPRPETTGQQRVYEPQIQGIELAIARPATGTLRAQYVIRVREPVMSEDATETTATLDGASGPARIPFRWGFATEQLPLERTVELWLSWSGAGELELSRPPTLF